MAKIRVFCIIGKSGSGKGTQVELLAKKLKGVKHIYAGDKLREFIKQPSALARKVAQRINQGYLAPDWLTDYLWQTELFQLSPTVRNILFEGTPRTVNQALTLDEVCRWMFETEPIAIYLDISDKEAKRRLLKRLVCQKCHQPLPYQLLAHPPKQCPFCGGPIVKRRDDREEAISERLKFFRKEVLPTIEFYNKKGRLIHVNGEQDVPAVFQELWEKLRKKLSSQR